MRPVLCLLTGLVIGIAFGPVDAGIKVRWGGSRRGGSTRNRTPAPPRRHDTSINNHFLNRERNQPSAPPAPKPPQTNGPIGFEGLGGTHQGNHQLGFDRVNPGVQNKPPYVPSAPQYPVSSHVPNAPPGYHAPGAPPQYNAPNGPPPAYPGYFGNNRGGSNDYPPAYPGRPMNAPPAYSPSNPHYGQTNSYQPGFGNNYPRQGQGYPQQNIGFSNIGGTYHQPSQFGSAGHGSYPTFGSSPYSGTYSGNSYHGNAYGGTPFGSTGYNGNPYFSPNNFGYSSNPGYFGSQPGYSGYPGQYNNYQKKSFFSGLPIPIPIPIPIGGFGGLGGGSHDHHLLNTFIRNRSAPNKTSTNSSTSVFVLNNSTVTPCTTDYFVYDLVKVTVIACTAEHCTAIKVTTTTNVSSVVSEHSVGLTMCLEKNVTFSYFSDIVSPTLSKVQHENITVCTNVSSIASDKADQIVKSEVVTTTESTTDATTTDAMTTVIPEAQTTTVNGTASNVTQKCDSVDCYWMEMCLPSVEVVDQCKTDDCPFRRTGYKPCLNLKMCYSPSAPVSSFASLNTTISKIDEYNNHNSVYQAANLTLISFHRPVISFNCTQNATQPSGGGPSLPPCAFTSPTNSTGT